MEIVKKRKRILYIGLILIVVLEFIILTAFLITKPENNLVLPSLAICIVLDSILFTMVYAYWIRKGFKEYVVAEVLLKHKPTIQYNYRMNCDSYKTIIKQYKLIPSAALFDFQDIIRDEVEGFHYTSMDLTASHQVSTGKSTVTVIDFKGRVYDVEVPKNHCNYILKEEKKKRVPEGYQALEMESIDFNSKFNLYVTDTHEAQKIFTPIKIQEAIKLEKKYDNVMMILDIEDHLYIFNHHKKDCFEHQREGYEQKIIEEYQEQYQFLMDYLKVLL